MTFDDILKESGDFGPAQWCLLSLFSLVNIFSAFHYFAQTFITLTPVQECLNGSGSNASLPLHQSENYTDFVQNPELITREFLTLSTELNWVCNQAWKSALVQSMFFIGSVAGTLLLGFLADLLGRIPVLIISNLLAVSGNLLTVYLIPNIWCLSVARFVAGLATDSNFFMMYIIVMEYMKPSLRTFGLNLCIGLWYCVGCILTPWLAVATKNWRIFLLSFSVPTVIIPLSCFFVPESAQWLLSVGRTNEAIDCFKKLASINQKKISKDFIDGFKNLTATSLKSQTQKKKLSGLFQTPCLRRKTLILTFKTIVLSLCYDAISRNIEGLGLDPFLVFTITSASIFPSCLVILLLQDKIGRKVMAILFLLLTGLFNIMQGMTLVLWKDVAMIAAIVGLLGRFSVNVAYNSGTQYAAELIPTQVRGQGLAVMHAIGYGATFFSPHILYLSNIWIATPQLILGFLSFSGALFCLFLPETLGKSLPVSLEDGEKFGESEKIWDFLKFKSIKKIESTRIN